MELYPNKKIQETLRAIHVHPPLPPTDLEKFKEITAFFGKSYAASEQEYAHFLADLEEFVSGSGKAAQTALEEEYKGDSTAQLRHYMKLRWNDQFENFIQTSTHNTQKTILEGRSVVDRLSIFAFGHIKLIEVLTDPQKAQLIPPQYYDHLIMALHAGVTRVPGAEVDQIHGMIAEHPQFMITTPYRIYVLRSQDGAEQISLPTLLKAVQQIFDEYNTAEEKHWLPLISCQERSVFAAFREALKSDPYCAQFLRDLDGSLECLSMNAEVLMNQSDLERANDFQEVLKGRLDQTWRGKENWNFHMGDLWHHNREHGASDGLTHLVYSPLGQNFGERADKGLREGKLKNAQLQEVSRFLTQVDTKRVIEHLNKTIGFNVERLHEYALSHIAPYKLDKLIYKKYGRKKLIEKKLAPYNFTSAAIAIGTMLYFREPVGVRETWPLSKFEHGRLENRLPLNPYFVQLGRLLNAAKGKERLCEEELRRSQELLTKGLDYMKKYSTECSDGKGVSFKQMMTEDMARRMGLSAPLLDNPVYKKMNKVRVVIANAPTNTTFLSKSRQTATYAPDGHFVFYLLWDDRVEISFDADTLTGDKLLSNEDLFAEIDHVFDRLMEVVEFKRAEDPANKKAKI